MMKVLLEHQLRSFFHRIICYALLNVIAKAGWRGGMGRIASRYIIACITARILRRNVGHGLLAIGVWSKKLREHKGMLVCRHLRLQHSTVCMNASTATADQAAWR